MRKYRKLYIIIVVAYAALLVVSRIYSVSSFLVDIVYLFSWIVLLFLEIRKQYHVKKNDKKEEIDYFPIILIFLMMVICIINMCNYRKRLLNYILCIRFFIEVHSIVSASRFFHMPTYLRVVIECQSRFFPFFPAFSRNCPDYFLHTSGSSSFRSLSDLGAR